MAHFLQAGRIWLLLSFNRSCACMAWLCVTRACARAGGYGAEGATTVPTAAGYCNVRRSGELHVCMRVHMNVGLD